VDDAVAANGEIDGDENFVLFFDIEPSDQPRIISLRRVEDDEFIYSEQEVIVAPGQIKAPIAVAVAEEAPEPEPEPAAEAPVAAVEEIAEDVTVAAVEDAKTEETESVVSQEPVKQVAEATGSDGDTVARISTQNVDEPTEESVETTQANVPAEVSETPAVGEAVEDAIEFAEAAPKNAIEDAADVEIAKAPEQPIQEEGVQKEETPTVMIADVSGVKIVSKAPASGENPEISLDAISYDEEGALTLAGRGVPSGLLRLYLNNAVIGETTTDALGAWSYDASALEPGVYTLRIDQLNADASKVLARMETPFKREARSKLQEQLSAAESPARINVVTVQPGNTLWGISRERYGQGILYVQVFEANRDKIRDPDLIYPGQIFNLPDDAAEEQ
jgi:nucleoid-associated protein YgaU